MLFRSEIRRLGGEGEEHEDGLTIIPKPLKACEIETYRDHRMAMSFALVATQIPGCLILDPQCTEKTYPLYFQDLGSITGTVPRFIETI